MDIYQYAMDMEKESENFYRGLADGCGNNQLHGVFTVLADEEVKHYNVLKALREGRVVKEISSSLVQDAKAAFESIRAGGRFTCDQDQIALYKQAQGLEERAKALYERYAADSTDQDAKDTFLRMASQENKHYWMLDNIIDLVQRPQQWLEDREWTNWDVY